MDRGSGGSTPYEQPLHPSNRLPPLPPLPPPQMSASGSAPSSTISVVSLPTGFYPPPLANLLHVSDHRDSIGIGDSSTVGFHGANPTALQPYHHPPAAHGYSQPDGTPPTSWANHQRNQQHQQQQAETKRRTKTGCLTCRKRRIKCDEGRPHCRNCEKSKRECLGYDAVVDSYSGASHSKIRLGQPSSTSSVARSSSGGNLFRIGTPASPSISILSYDGLDSFSSIDAAASDTQSLITINMARSNYPAALQPQRTVKSITIEDLFALNEIRPKYIERDAPPAEAVIDQQELDRFFQFHYAGALDRFFETTWYSTHGLAYIRQTPSLQDFVSQCSEKMKDPAEATNKAMQSLEARLVWQFIIMPRALHMQSTTKDARTEPTRQELLPRIDTVEKLLTGQFLDPNAVPPAPPAQESSSSTDAASLRNNDSTKHSQSTFWYQLARFASLRDDLSASSPASATNLANIASTLHTLRGLLDVQEPRDILYSMALLRHVGGRMPDYHPRRYLVATTNDPADDVAQLKVAQNFLEQEERGGSSQVVQRICGMALRGVVLQRS